MTVNTSVWTATNISNRTYSLMELNIFTSSTFISYRTWCSHSDRYECCHLPGYSADRCLATCCTQVPCSADFLPWRWRWYVPPKRRFTYGLHGAIPQKTATYSLFQSEETAKKCVRKVIQYLLLGWFSTMKIDVIRSSETSVHIRTTRRCIPEDGNIPLYFNQKLLLKRCVCKVIQYFLLRNVGSHMDYATLYPRRWQHSTLFQSQKSLLKRCVCKVIQCLKFDVCRRCC
jgi:hypothetical protein